MHLTYRALNDAMAQYLQHKCIGLVLMSAYADEYFVCQLRLRLLTMSAVLDNSASPKLLNYMYSTPQYDQSVLLQLNPCEISAS